MKEYLDIRPAVQEPRKPGVSAMTEPFLLYSYHAVIVFFIVAVHWSVVILKRFRILNGKQKV